MRAAEYRFTWSGDELRVVVAGDVLSLPGEGWARGGFGASISGEWLLHEARLPRPAPRRRALAECLVRALDQHHRGHLVAPGDLCREVAGPVILCRDCGGRGFVAPSGDGAAAVDGCGAPRYPAHAAESSEPAKTGECRVPRAHRTQC